MPSGNTEQSRTATVNDALVFRRAVTAAISGLVIQVILLATTGLTALWGDSQSIYAAAWHMLGGLAMGCLDGGVGAAQNFIPEPLVQVYEAYHAGDHARAKDLCVKCARVIQIQGMYTFGPTTYAILGLLGFDMGPARPPAQKVAPADAQRVRKALSTCVSDAPFDEKRLIESRDLL